MVTEDYVSFDTAKLLKEKGFTEGEDCFGFYDKKGSIHLCQTFGDISDYDEDTCIDAPTLQMAMKWLREERGLNVYARAVWKDVEVQYGYWEEAVVGYDCFIESLSYNNYLKTNAEEPFRTYEEACESAIKYCLENLI